MLRKGTSLGKYRLEALLDRGAYATVWRARDTIEGRRVALKVMSKELIDGFEHKELEREARIASRLKHPHIASIENADWIDGVLVFAQPLAETNLADYRKPRRSAGIALSVLRDVTAGLAYAHENFVVHRDVKPENILIFKDGHAALCDFGISRLTTHPQMTVTEAGTLGYVAPEQAYGRPAYTSDVFSLGMVFYELITGSLPKWPFEWPPLGYSKLEDRMGPYVSRVIGKAIQFDPKKRYLSGTELQEALTAACEKPAQRIHRKRRRATAVKSARDVAATYFRRVHGRELQLQFNCWKCDGPVSEAMHCCPWCGTQENSFIEVSPSSNVCPQCEKGVRPEWTSCPWCSRVRLDGNGRRAPYDPRAERECTHRGCSGQIRRFMRGCPLCKRKVKRPWVLESLPDRCPHCRWSVSVDYWRHCAWCSKSLGRKR